MPTVLELYEKLKPKLGEEETRALLEFVEASVDRKAASKEDLQRTASALKEDLQRTESALKEDLQRTESSLREEIHRVESSLREEIQNVKVDLIKWSFAFWVGAIAVLSGLMLAMLRAFTGK
jgi:DNA repair exonuclease SbcCD ATPase subunit